MRLHSFIGEMFQANPRLPYLATRVLLTVFFAYIPLRLSPTPEAISHFWYANAWLAAILVQLPYRRWLPVSLAGMLCSFTGCVLGGQILPIALLYLAPNFFHVLAIAFSIRQLNIWPDVGESPKHLARFLVTGLAVPTLVVGIPAAALLALRLDGFWANFFQWFTGSMITGVGLLPFLAAVTCEIQAGERPSWLNLRTFGIIAAATGAVFLYFSTVSNPFVLSTVTIIALALTLSFAGTSLAIFVVTNTAGVALLYDFYNFPNVGVELHENMRGISLPLTSLPPLLISVFV